MATEARAIIDYELISSSPGATYQVDFEVRGVPHVAVNVSQRDDYELLTLAEGSPGASATGRGVKTTVRAPTTNSPGASGTSFFCS